MTLRTDSFSISGTSAYLISIRAVFRSHRDTSGLNPSVEENKKQSIPMSGRGIEVATFHGTISCIEELRTVSMQMEIVARC